MGFTDILAGRFKCGTDKYREVHEGQAVLFFVIVIRRLDLIGVIENKIKNTN